MNRPNPMREWPSEGVGQGRCCRAWLAMLGFVSVGYTPQTTDICVCRRHVKNVGPAHQQHSVMSAYFFADKVVSGETAANTASTSTSNSRYSRKKLTYE